MGRQTSAEISGNISRNISGAKVDALKMVIFSLAVVGFYSWYANYIPQIESHPPKKIALDAALSPEEMISAGERIFSGKGTCNICHAIGRPGNRGPDLAGIANTAARRRPKLTAKQYLLQSLLEPRAFLVKGYGALMPPMAAILTPGEIMVTVAFLQSLGGEPDVVPEDVRGALARLPQGAGAAPAPSAEAAPAAQPAAAAPMAKSDPARGKAAYLASCVACHGPDPSVDGPIGPSIRGASYPLIEARVMRAGYPPGHQPKRATKLMPPMPQLQAELPHLAAFLREQP